jgi:predicted tellurium resistance membrane protein TerC
MYFLMADMADRFHLLGYGLAVIVTLVGMKMLLMNFLPHANLRHARLCRFDFGGFHCG